AHGIQGLWICGNIMNITNCHRVFKLQDTTGSTNENEGTSYHTKKCWIKNNEITATTDSGKQVIDAFNFTSDLWIEDNYFEVSGFGSIVENKTGLTTSYSQNTFINKN